MTYTGKPAADNCEALRVLLECGCERAFEPVFADMVANETFLQRFMHGDEAELYCQNVTHDATNSQTVAVWTQLNIHHIKGW